MIFFLISLGTEILKKVAEKNGIGHNDLKLGRGDRPIDFTDTSVSEVA